MDTSSTLNELETLAEKLGVKVVYDHFTGDAHRSGGLCKLRGEWRVIIEKRGSAAEKVAILAKSLSRFDLEAFFVSPAVRQLLMPEAA